MRFCAAILDAEGLRLTGGERALYRAVNPFGFILFSRNLGTKGQIRALCGEMRDAVGRDAPILIDQEGGRVQRLYPPLARTWPAAFDFVTVAGANAPRAMRLRYRLIAAELRALGIDVNCAPVADIAMPVTHPFLRDRCYGADLDTVTACARAVADGLLQGGVLPVLKHLPGHGRAGRDSHAELPCVTAASKDLERLDFAAFAALNDLPMGMTAHVVFKALDSRPATLSPAIIARIREDMGFSGLLMSDDLSMKSLTGARPKLAREAIAAGCDVALLCNASLRERAAVAEAVGEMTRASQIRAETALAVRRAPESLDTDAVETELAALFGDHSP